VECIDFVRSQKRSKFKKDEKFEKWFYSSEKSEKVEHPVEGIIQYTSL
jgi:hypothetical protein